MRSAIAALVCTALLAATAAGCKEKRRASADESASDEKKETKANAIPGVSEDEILLGQSSVFLGPNAGYGTEYYRGAMAYFLEVNAKGGVHGRKIAMRSMDDGYLPDRTVENGKAFMASNDVFCLFGTITTGQVIGLAKALLEKKDQDWFLFGNHSGSQGFRDKPLMDAVFNWRTSYRREGETLVNALMAAGKKKVGILKEPSPYGEALLDAYTRALTKNNLTPVGVQNYTMNMKFEDSLTAQAKALKDAGADSVMVAGVYASAAAFVRDASEMNWDIPMAFNSPVSDTFLRTINAYEQKTNKKLNRRLLHAQVTPALDSPLPGMVEYRDLMDKRNPQPPRELVDPNYRTNRYGFTSAEAFFAAKTFVEVLNRVGPNLTRAKFRETVEQLRDYDPGLGGATLTITSEQHDGLNKAWLLGVKNGAFVDITDPREYLGEKPVQAKR